MIESKLPRIDIIIPCYRAHKLLPRALGSVIAQTYVDNIDVTLVNDCCDEGDYSDIVKSFSPFVSIREIKNPKNVGPGPARQNGLESTSNPLVMFIDHDDSLAGAFCLELMVKKLFEEPGYHSVFANFLEENQKGVYVTHQMDTVWLFSKLYMREFLNKYNIKFHKTSNANEDNGFNMMVKLCSNEREKIKFIPDICYYWHSRPDSITRRDNCNYSYNDSFTGYVENMIYSISESELRNPFNGAIALTKVNVLCNLYEYFIETVARDPRYVDQNFKACLDYYTQIYRPIKDKITDQVLADNYSEVMRNACGGGKMMGIIPVMGIKEWLAKLEEDYQKNLNKSSDKKEEVKEVGLVKE